MTYQHKSIRTPRTNAEVQRWIRARQDGITGADFASRFGITMGGAAIVARSMGIEWPVFDAAHKTREKTAKACSCGRRIADSTLVMCSMCWGYGGVKGKMG